jgi:hypothetical protein
MARSQSNFWKKRSKILLICAIFIIVILATVGTIRYLMPQTVYDKGGLPTGPVSYELISSRPEAKLYYPDSQVLSPFGQPEKQGDFISGSERAFAGAILTSSDKPEKIYQWYRDWLLAHGWQSDEHAFGGLASTQISLQGYSKGQRETLYIAINDPKQLGWTLGKKVPANMTVFEIRYFISIYENKQK